MDSAATRQVIKRNRVVVTALSVPIIARAVVVAPPVVPFLSCSSIGLFVGSRDLVIHVKIGKLSPLKFGITPFFSVKKNAVLR